jgi:2-polyprenyl-6-methoxyphenol hydroxylase-like FAD-dependent oxidoreductase
MLADCCVVGGGPAGVTLSLLLARAGVAVTLLEAHKTFERDFRGDTIHPSTLELLDQIGLADRLHELPHTKMGEFQLRTPAGIQSLIVFKRLRTRFPYVMVMPQARFLEFLVAEARRYAHFHLVMGATVQRLIDEAGAIRGVGYAAGDESTDLRATLTVGCDGRFSRVRKLAGLESTPQSARMEVLWFRLPRHALDRSEDASITVGHREFLVLLGRPHEWQVGYVVQQGGYARAKQEGLEALRFSVLRSFPWLADRVALLEDWKQVNVLAVQADRLRRWYRPGLLLIGDAAHAMLPVAGVGINCAIADAAQAANILADPLRCGPVVEADLADVQRRRERPTRIIQAFQLRIQERLIGQALASAESFTLPLPVRLLRRVPLMRDLPGRLVGLGIPRVQLDRPQERPPRHNTAQTDGSLAIPVRTPPSGGVDR